jgi:ferric-dicitrate binding protein FerR (iron transport regulator)
MLKATGSVMVNDAYVKRSTALFDGDRVEVCQDSAAALNQSGSTIGLTPDSYTRYQKESLEVMHGTARIDTTSGMAARFGDVSVAPAQGSAKFELTRANKQVQVASREGALKITNGGHTADLASGASTTLPDPQESQAPTPSCAPPKAAAWQGGMSSHKALAIDLGWSAGGVLCAYLCVTDQGPVSQDNPGPR